MKEKLFTALDAKAKEEISAMEQALKEKYESSVKKKPDSKASA